MAEQQTPNRAQRRAAERPRPAGRPVDPNRLTLDIDSLTLGEVEQLEDMSGMRLDQFDGKGTPPMKMVTALVYIVRKRTEPDLTLEAVRAMKVSELNAATENSSEDPTSAVA